MSGYIATDRLCLTEDESQLVPEDSPEARWLYCIPGQEIPLDEAVKYGLIPEPVEGSADDIEEDEEEAAAAEVLKPGLHEVPEVKRSGRVTKKTK